MTPRRRSSKRGRSLKSTWPRSPSGYGAAWSGGSGSTACSTPLPLPTCSPGRTAGFQSMLFVRITLLDRDVPSYFRSLDHLLRYCARPPFALERLSVIRGPPTDCGELVQMHDERGVSQATERRAARDRHPQPLSRAGLEVTTKRPAGRTRRDSALTPEKCHSREEDGRSGKRFLGSPRRDQPAPRGSRVVQQSGHACGSAIGRPILFIMTLRAS